jgi:hypothetical protein
MTIMKILCPQGRRLSLIAVCLLSVWPPLSARSLLALVPPLMVEVKETMP